MPVLRAREVAALAAAGWLVLGVVGAGCASSRVQVASSKPHANVQVSIEHLGDEKGVLYDDALVVDGVAIPVGRGHGGHIDLRLRPGAHRIEVSSAQLDYTFETRLQRDPTRQCAGDVCRAQAPTPTLQTELVSSAEVRCEQPMDLLVQAGDDVRVTLTVGPGRTCDVCTGNPLGPCGR